MIAGVVWSNVTVVFAAIICWDVTVATTLPSLSTMSVFRVALTAAARSFRTSVLIDTVLKPEDQLRKPGSCGRAVLNVETRVVDDAMRDVKPGDVGEIVHRSPHLMLGYFHDDERTKAAFEGGWFHSGDLATIDAEGYISVVDRKKDMIKTGGENVASRDVEEVIYRLPQVSEVAVVGTPHPRWVEAVVAVVVVKPGQALDEDAVLARVAARDWLGLLDALEPHELEMQPLKRRFPFQPLDAIRQRLPVGDR